ncbi:MAG: hypothetical protein Q9178_000679 [Gyalolechia marmorata]
MDGQSQAPHQPHESEPLQGEDERDAEGLDVDDSASDALALFQPFWLRAFSLIALFVTFTLCWLILVVLYRVASSEHGLSLTITSSHYAWTYGPTVILTCLLSFWRQVDYYCRLTQPWRQLAKKASSAQESVLLDYVSPMYATSLYKAIRRGHIPVAVSIMTFVLLKVIIVVSTGLLDASSTSSSYNQPVYLTNNFNASKMWDRVSRQTATYGNAVSLLNNVKSDILWAYLDELNGKAPDENHVKNGKVFQSFDILDSPNNITSAHAIVDVVAPKVTCEVAQVDSPHLNMSDYTLPINYKSSTTYCSTYGIRLWDSKTFAYKMDLVNCTDLGSKTNTSTPRFALAAVDYPKPSSGYNISENSDSEDVFITNASGVLCEVGYQMQRGNLTRNLLSEEMELAIASQSATSRPNLTDTDLSTYIVSSFDQGADELQIETTLSDDALDTTSNVIFPFIYKYLGSSAANKALLDPKDLARGATSVFEGLVLQFAQLELLQPARIESTGSVTASTNRLQVRTAPLIAMIVMIALVTCLILVTILVVRQRVVRQQPGSIASYASILARSSTLQPLLQDTGDMRTSELTRKLNGLRYQVSHTDHIFEIEVSSGNKESARAIELKTKHSQWIPWAVRIPLLALVFALPLLAIVILEVLQQTSNKNAGIAELQHGDSDAVSYVARYGSTLAVLLIATMYNNLDFTITTFTPFHALLSGMASARESISLNLVGQIPVVALFSCLRHKKFGTALSIFAALVGSFLTIISSGLWIVDDQVLGTVKVQNALGSSWNLTWANNSGSDAGAAKMLNTLDFGSSQEPLGIWTSFALPSLGQTTIRGKGGKALDPPKEDDNSLQRFVFDIEGLQPELNCTVCPKKDIHYTEAASSAMAIENGVSKPFIESSLEAVFRLSAKCHNIGSNQSTVVGLPYMYTNNSKPSLIGKLFDLNIVFDRLGTSEAGDRGPDPDGCPSIGILFGYYENITALLCSQRIRSVPMNVTYSGDPGAGRLNAQHPPVVSDHSSPKYMLDGTPGLPTFRYRLRQHLVSGISYFPSSVHNESSTVDGLLDTEPIFDHLLHGPYNVSGADIIGPERAQDFITAFNKVYNKYMIQVLNTVLRSSSVNATTVTTLAADGAQEQIDTHTVNGTLTRRTTRLKMNNASKLTLQIMFAVMVVLSGLAVHFIKIRGTLPRDPYSIASQMGFLAGSEMCTPQSGLFSPGSEFLSIGELNKSFNGQKFRLGWWSAPIAEKNGTVSSRASQQGDTNEGLDAERYSVADEHHSSRDEDSRDTEEAQRQSRAEGTTRFGIDLEGLIRRRRGRGRDDDETSSP